MHSQRVRHDWATELNWIEIYAYIKCFLRIYFGASKVALMVKNLPASAPDGRSRGVQPPDQGDRVRKEMATHSSILAGRIPWTEEPGRQQSAGSKIVWHHWPQCSSKKIFYQLLPSGRGLGVSAEEVTFHLKVSLELQFLTQEFFAEGLFEHLEYGLFFFMLSVLKQFVINVWATVSRIYPFFTLSNTLPHPYWTQHGPRSQVLLQPPCGG